MTEWRYYGCPNAMAVFIHLLLSANYRDGYVFGVEVKRGQILTSEEGIMRSISIKRGALRSVLKNLEKSGEITRESTNKYSLITICNYESYQEEESKRSKFIAPTIEEVSEYINDKGLKVSPKQFWEYYNNVGWTSGQNHIKNWKSCVIAWSKKKKRNGRTQITESNGVSQAGLGRKTEGGREHH